MPKPTASLIKVGGVLVVFTRFFIRMNIISIFFLVAVVVEVAVCCTLHLVATCNLP